MFKDDPRTESFTLFLMAIDTYHMHSNESERANLDINDDIKLKKNLWSLAYIYKNISGGKS